MFEALAEAIEDTEIPLDERELAEAHRLLGRLAAKVSAADGEFAAADLYELDGSASMTAWLRQHAGMTNPAARRAARTAEKLHAWAATRNAWLDGRLTQAQVAIIEVNVFDAASDLWAAHETSVVPTLVGLDARDTATVMHEWARRAHQLLDESDPTRPPDEPERQAHLSRLLSGGRLDADLDPEAFETVRKAFDVARRPDDDGEERTPARRRADALVDICRFFLQNETEHSDGRHRPHIVVVVDLDDLEQRGPGSFFSDGTAVDPETIRRIACDAGIHSIFTRGSHANVVAAGSDQRTVPTSMFEALVVRDRGCRFPGCDRGPRWTEAHHIIHWEDGGPTILDNLALLCWHHHHRLHERRWRLKLLPDATVEVTLPDGRVRSSRPPVHV